MLFIVINEGLIQGMCDFFKNKSNLFMVRIPNCPAVNTSVLQSLLEYCPKLAALDLTGCENVTDDALQFLGMMENITWLAISNTLVRDLLCKLSIISYNK